MNGFLGLEELDTLEDQASASNASALISARHPPKAEDSSIFDFHDFAPKDTKTPENRSKQRLAKTSNANHQAQVFGNGILNPDTASRFMALDELLPLVMPDWENLHLTDKTLRGIHTLNFSTPTDIQKIAIPAIMAGRDVIGKASTGSGKTLAFGIPILEHLSTVPAGVVETTALILAPTRELAQQISQHLASAGRFIEVSIVTITGGLAIEKQLRQLKHLPDIIVATPGRLWDIMSSHPDLCKQLLNIKYLVLDEADRLLQTGHFKQVGDILDALQDPQLRQTLIFSATFTNDLQHKLNQGIFNSPKLLSHDQDSLEALLGRIQFRAAPVFFDANPESLVAKKVNQCLIETSPVEKDYFLYFLLLRYPARTLVFTNSISDVHRIVRMLNTLGLPVLGLHSNKQQKSRLKAIERFKQDHQSVLIATDVAARGLDIPLVDTVVHYHLPRSADLYIHRSGRTARANTEGLSIIICSPTEIPVLKRMQKAVQLSALNDFAVNHDHVGQIKPRVNVARQILKLEDEMHKRSGSRDAWLTEAANDLGVELHDEEVGSDSLRLRNQIKALKIDLKQRLKTAFVKSFNGKYPTKGGAVIARRLLQGGTHLDFVGEQVQKPSEHHFK